MRRTMAKGVAVGLRGLWWFSARRFATAGLALLACGALLNGCSEPVAHNSDVNPISSESVSSSSLALVADDSGGLGGPELTTTVSTAASTQSDWSALDTCSNVANGSVCSSDACKTGQTCQDGVCTGGTNAADGTACDDGDACTRSDVCGAGRCQGGAAVVCGAPGQCHSAGTCVPSTGQCHFPTVLDGTGCYDANPCTTGDACLAGTCTGAALSSAPLCDDVACRSIESLSSSGLDICVKLAGGRVDCWGNGSQNFGASGPPLLAPTPEPQLTGTYDFSNSFFHSCVVRPDGTIKCWGRNDYGQLGDGTNTDRPDGVIVPGIKNAKRVRVMPYSTCAILGDDSVSCWGNNGWGQLGDGTGVSSNVPVAVRDLGPVADLTTNSVGVFALMADHSVKYWGQVYNNALPQIPNALSPVEVPELRGATQVALGMDHMCALMNDGSVKCAGNNAYGALGNGSLVAAAVPRTVSGLSEVKKVGSGYWFSCALLLDGTARCWGFNGHAALGVDPYNLSQEDLTVPLPVAGIAKATDLVVIGGGFDSCVLLNGCSVECWGHPSGLGIGSNDIPSPSLARTALVPTELNSLSVAATCRMPDSNNGLFIVRNTASIAVDSPVGQYNYFADTPDHLQPVTFEPGYTAFEVALSAGTSLRWTLGGGSGLLNAESPLCSIVSSGDAPQIDVNGTTYDVSPLSGQADACAARFLTCGTGTLCDQASGTCVPIDASNALAPIDVCLQPGATAEENVAVFIYENRSSSVLETEIGNNNQFDLDSPDRGQPRSFAPGVGAFSTKLNPAGDTWTLGAASLRASSATPVCQISANGVHDEVSIGGKSYQVPPLSPGLQPEPVVGAAFNGALQGTFAVGPSGAATYTVPLPVPPGIRGMAPSLSLVYSSQSGNGIAGQGWNLSGLSVIGRCAKTMLATSRSLPVGWTEEDALCLDGKRLYPFDSTAGPGFTSDTNDFSRIKQVADANGKITGFELTTKTGMRHYYASRPENAVKLGAANDTAALWLLDRVEDEFGNWFRITYNQGANDFASNGVRVTKIEYTGHGTEEPFYSVDFDYDVRPDQRYSFIGGLPVWQKFRLKGISTARGVYGFHYMDDGRDARDLPSRLQEISYQSGGESLGSLSFGWDWADVGFDEFDAYRLPQDVDLVTTYTEDGPPQQKSGTQFVDVNSDGLVDIVQAISGKPFRAWRNTGAGWAEDPTLALPTDHGGAYLFGQDGEPGSAQFVDWDGDGRLDIVSSFDRIAPYGMRVWLNRVALGAGWQFQPDLSPAVTFGRGGLIIGETFNFRGEYRLVDLNGDGRVDIASLADGSARINGLGRDVAYDLPQNIRDIYDAGESWRIAFQDLDRDGLSDITVRRGSGNPNVTEWNYDLWRNTGHSGSDPTQRLPSDSSKPAPSSAWVVATDESLPQLRADFYRIFNGDVNGDGRLDVIQFGDRVTKNAPGTLSGPPGTDPSEYFKPHETYSAVVKVATDVGGWGEGAGFQASLPAALGLDALGDGYGVKEQVIQVADLNADGLVDLMQESRFRLNNGTSWSSFQTKYLPVMPSIGTSTDNAAFMSGNAHDNGARFFDLNGDGVLDLVQAQKGTPHGAWLNHARVPRIKEFPNGTALRAQVSYVVTTAESGVGTYVHEPQDTAQAHAIAAPVTVVSQVLQDTGVDTSETPYAAVRYTYRGLKASSHGLGMFGFREVSVLDQVSGIQTDTTYAQVYPYVGQVIETLRHVGSRVLSHSKADYCDSQQRSDIGGSVTCSTLEVGRGYVPGGNVFVNPKSVSDTSYLDGSGWVRVTTEHEYDTFGNATKTTVTTTGSNGDAATSVTESTYDGITLEGVQRGHASKVVVTNSSASPPLPTLRHVTEFAYEPGTWFMKEKIDESGEGVSYEVRTFYRPDEYGNVIRSVACADDLENCGLDSVAAPSAVPYRVVDTSYEPSDFGAAGAPISQITDYGRGRYPVRVSDARGHVQYFVYDPLYGEKLQSTAADGLHTCQQLDAFGQVAATTALCGTPRATTATVKTFEATLADSPSATRVTVTRPAAGSPSWVYSDRLGRKVATLSRSFEGGFVETIWEYDRQGRAYHEAAPSKAGPQYWTTKTFDVQGRVKRIDQELADVDGTGLRTVSTIMNTNGFTTTTTKRTPGMPDRTTTENHDARGRVVAATDPKGDKTIFFLYDVEGRLTDVGASGDPGTLLSKVTWDHGRKVTSRDADMGTWHYDYNGFGDLVLQTDANQKTVQIAYDEIGRLAAKISREGVSSWYYDDTPGPSNGKLLAIIGAPDPLLLLPCEVPGIGTGGAGNRAAKWFHYDTYGEVDETFECVDGEVFSTRQGFDRFGRVESVTYPAIHGQRSSVRYGYSSAGYLQTVSDGSSGDTLWAAREIDALGETLREETKNGLETISDRNEVTGWLRSRSTRPAGQSSAVVVAGAYRFDPFGNLQYRSQQTGGLQVEDSYTYDLLERVESVQTFVDGASVSADTFTYDDFGNLTTKNGRTLQYGAGGDCAGTHRLCSVEHGPQNRYDANGNLLQDLSHNVSYNLANKVTHIERVVSNGPGDVPGAVDIVYGALDVRVLQQTTDAQGVTNRTVYVGLDNAGHSFYERSVHGDTTEHVQYLYAPGHEGQAFAIRTLKESSHEHVESLRFNHRDHLGSVIAVTDENGQIAVAGDGAPVAASYDTWGARRSVDSATPELNGGTDLPGRRGYTGHEYVASVGLVNMNGRVYDPELGRFLSPDPTVQAAANLQSYNRYSYVFNNPLRYTDPTGFSAAPYTPGPGPGWWERNSFAVMEGVLVLAATVACAETGGAGCALIPVMFAAFNASTAIADGADPYSTIALTTVSIGVGFVTGGAASSLTNSMWSAALAGAVSSAGTTAIMSSATGNLAWQDLLISAAEGAVGSAAGYAQRGARHAVAEGLDKEANNAAKRAIAEDIKREADRTGHVSSGKIGQLPVKFYGGTEETRTEAWRELSRTFTESKAGRDKLAAMEARPAWRQPGVKELDIVIFDSSVPGTSIRGSAGLISGQLILLDLNDLSRTYVSDWPDQQFSLLRIFAHELGHVAMGMADEGPGKMSNVNAYENPHMQQMGYWANRTAYYTP